jgi:mono/diheme cytochrome c family protein
MGIPLAPPYDPTMTRRIASVIAAALGCILISMGCASATSDASATPISIKSQLASGAPIYAQNCATSTCHGTQGEGIKSGSGFKVWPLVGEEFQSRHPNAQIVFDVIRSGSERNLLALTDQQIYNAIAYELNQNQITLQSPITADNAHATSGGKMSGEAQGRLFPPSNNAILIDPPFTRGLPIAAQNERLRIQVDQIAHASAIGNDSGAFFILVLVFNDLGDEPITVSPDYLSLSTPGGEVLQPQQINIQSAIEKFHTRTIKPQHGTAGLVVFTLSTPEDFDQLIYDDGVGEPLTLALKP